VKLVIKLENLGSLNVVREQALAATFYRVQLMEIGYLR
jgi:hypothetical protein